MTEPTSRVPAASLDPEKGSAHGVGDMPLSAVSVDGVVREPQADVAGLVGGPWDGRRYSYIPSEPLVLDPGVRLHGEFDLELDPVTYQVLRSRLWHMNLEHGDMIQRIAGSFVVVFARDYSVAVLTEDGDIVTIGPTIQHLGAQGDLVVKWTLEHRGGAPGIDDGDVFLQNDPFVGCAHQVDTAMCAPVFWEGRIFCWVYNCCHIGDLGGVDPGGSAVHARDMFDEAVTVPPLKMVDRGELQVDRLEAFARQSREPAFIVLGVKSQVAGINLMRRGMLELLERYGARVVKGAMRRAIADTSRLVGERLRAIPDGTWRERVYVGGATGRERSVHVEMLSLTKRGDRITCTNEGTSPQEGSGNSPYAVLRASVVAALMTALAPDQLGCAAGVANHVRFVPVPGTRTAATWPAACSSLFSALTGLNTAPLVVSKMLLSAPEAVRAQAHGSCGRAVPAADIAHARDAEGNYLSYSLLSAVLAGSIGAFPYRDGIDTGGSWYLLGTRASNVEEAEQDGSLLGVYRGENPDSGGPGRWRGGCGPRTAYMPHRNHVFVQMTFIDPAVNTVKGLAGGYHGLGLNLLRAENAKLGDAIAAGRWPGHREQLEEITGAMTRIGPREFIAPLPPGDVIVVEHNAGGGYGDPLQREPERVREDVELERVSRAAAARHYGVIVDEAGVVDVRATTQAREAIRDRRLQSATLAAPAERLGTIGAGEVVLAGAAGGVDVVSVDGEAHWACSSCAEDLGKSDENFKHAAACLQSNPHEVDELMYTDPAEDSDPTIVLRQYFCPACATLLSQEMCPADADPLFDFQIHRPTPNESL